MKKKLIALAIVSIATISGTTGANAQMVSNSTSSEYQRSLSETTNPMTSPRALKNFANTYKNVKDEMWLKTNDGFAVRFTSGGIRTTVLYDKKGYWTGSIKYYGEEKMLHEIRHDVKSKYYDYKIIYTQEIETPDSEGMPTYVICVEDQANIKLIRICDGEMSVWKEYTKNN
jgi:hypothetical protein